MWETDCRVSGESRRVGTASLRRWPGSPSISRRWGAGSAPSRAATTTGGARVKPRRGAQASNRLSTRGAWPSAEDGLGPQAFGPPALFQLGRDRSPAARARGAGRGCRIPFAEHPPERDAPARGRHQRERQNLRPWQPQVLGDAPCNWRIRVSTAPRVTQEIS
jgi:hypothetical protein